MHDEHGPSTHACESYMLVARHMSTLSCCTQGMRCCWSMERLQVVCLGGELVSSSRLWVPAGPSGRLSCGISNEILGKFVNNNNCETFQPITQSLGHSIEHSIDSMGRTVCCQHHILCKRRWPGQNHTSRSGGLERASACHRALADCRCPNQSDSLATS